MPRKRRPVLVDSTIRVPMTDKSGRRIVPPDWPMVTCDKCRYPKPVPARKYIVPKRWVCFDCCTREGG